MILVAFLLSGQNATGAAQGSPEIWFFLRSYTASPQNWHGVDGQQGWRKLFLEPEEPWPPFMDHVQVVALASGAVAATPDDVLAKAFAKLKQHHIKFAIESLALSWVGFQEHCGKGVESFTDPSGNAQIARKINAAGGELAYVAMDEPLFNGRYYGGPNACHDSIRMVAERAAATMREYRRVFPNVMIGDTEPFPALTKQPNWREEHREWLDAFDQVFGKLISFLNIDINWPEDNWHWQHSQDITLGRAPTRTGQISMMKSPTRSSPNLRLAGYPGFSPGYGCGKSAAADAEERVDQPAIQWR